MPSGSALRASNRRLLGGHLHTQLRRSNFSVVGLDRTTDQVGDCARVGLQHLG